MDGHWTTTGNKKEKKKKDEKIQVTSYLVSYLLCVCVLPAACNRSSRGGERRRADAEEAGGGI